MEQKKSMPQSTVGRPESSEYAHYYERYVSLVPEEDIIQALSQQIKETLTFLQTVPDGDKRYAPGKWSIKEVVGHMIDAERVFAYRSLHMARRDPAPLPGFEQDDWVAAADFSAIDLGELAAELNEVRQANLRLYRQLSQDAWVRRGTASGNEISVRALAYIIAGHERYHLDILRTRYS
jgi:hypothetical protein